MRSYHLRPEAVLHGILAAYVLVVRDRHPATMNSPTSRFDEAMRAALASERAARWEQAGASYVQALSAEPARPLPYLCLGCVLGRLGRHNEAAQVLSLGQECNSNLLNVWRSDSVERAVADRSRYADTLFRRFMAGLHQQSVAACERELGCGPVQRVRSAIWCQTHPEPFSYGHPLQRPWLLYLPELDPVPWFDPVRLPWADDLLDRFAGIRAEVLTALQKLEHAAQPYIAAESPVPDGLAELHGSLRWSSIQLFRAGRAADRNVLDAFPETAAALESLDCVRLNGNPMEAVVSMLAPETQISPHYGLANTRLTVHVPILVPDGCSITVAGDRRSSQEGQLMAFDDGFLHQADNPSDQVRVHLLFEAWRPDLDESERLAIARSMEDRERWNHDRRIPDFSGVSVL